MNRDGIFNFLSSLIVIIAGLAIGFVILLISDASQAVPAFMTILTFGTSSMRNVGDVLLFATPIILTGLSVAFAFRTGLFNIGASGQFTFGAFVAIYISVEMTFLPPPVRIVTAIVAAAVVGALWGAIPGMLKAYRNVHEVIACIMTNYIAMFFVNYMIITHIFDQGRGTSTALPSDSNLPSLGFENIFREPLGATFRSSHVNIGILIAIAIAILVYVILEKTTFGYELKACGFNKDAAKYAGINQNRNIIVSMMFCGALAGIGGALNYMNGTGLSMSIIDSLATEGFTGISVAFLGLNHPIGIIFSGILVSFLYLGGARMQVFGFSIELIEVVISIIIYFCAFVFLVRTFLSKTAGKYGKKEAAKEGGESA
ncbi:MAG: ABC transporter permease [Defluviitaleaceae bacterium]|nr:ABC transporter permease [Defluviitaleaceae bacterium]